MLKAQKYRLYPTPLQIDLINQHIGSCRFIYNLALETKQMAYAGNKVNLSCFDLMKQMTDLKKELPWLKEVNAQSLQQAITNMDTAYTNFFKGRADFPKFKKKTGRGSFRIPQSIKIQDNKFFFPKFKEGIRIILDRPIIGIIKQATISRTPSGKYFVSILIDTQISIPQRKEITEEGSIGIDLGLKSFLVTSDGQTFDNQRFYKKNLKRLKFLQSRASKYKGKRTRHKLALLHEKIANQRNDFLHKISTQLIKSHDSLCIEDLNIKGMLQNHSLAQAISDVSWSEFVRQLTYKAEWYGTNIIKIGRFDPSSKTCSNCGGINKELTLSDREWTCIKCDTKHDRDLNAAKNIKAFGLRNHLSGEHRHQNQGELPTMVGVMTPEIS